MRESTSPYDLDNAMEFTSETRRRAPFRFTRLQAALDLVTRCRPKTVADIGAGDGLFSESLRSLFSSSQILSIDLSSSEMKTFAGKRSERIALIVADARHLPLRDHSMSLSCALELIEHFDEPDAELFLSEMKRITAIGGNLLLSTPNSQSFTSRSGQILFKLLGRKWMAGSEDHKKIYTVEQLINALGRKKFSVQSFRTVWFLPAGISLVEHKFSNSASASRAWVAVNLSLSKHRTIRRLGHIIVVLATPM